METSPGTSQGEKEEGSPATQTTDSLPPSSSAPLSGSNDGKAQDQGDSTSDTDVCPSATEESGERDPHQSMLMDLSLSETEADYQRKSFDRHLKVS